MEDIDIEWNNPAFDDEDPSDYTTFHLHRIHLLEQFYSDVVKLRMVELFGNATGNISWSRFADAISRRPLTVVPSGRIDPAIIIDDIDLDYRRIHSRRVG